MKSKKLINALLFGAVALPIALIVFLMVGGLMYNRAALNMPEKLLYGEVIQVVDGDTFFFQAEGENPIKIRLIGVDAPESVHPDQARNTEEGKIASKYTKDILLNERVGLEFDVQMSDDYGRVLAYVWLSDGTLFNLKILEDGHAALMTVPPNVKYVKYFRRV